jgi:hippurate hydrolase
MKIHEGIGRTGVVASFVGAARQRRMVGLRADMDALPMTEHNDFAWKSCKPGLMHGCGHDGHTAMLVGAARYLARRNFDGTAVLIFQPGEEGFAGARVMMEDGCSTAFPCSRSTPCTTGPA